MLGYATVPVSILLDRRLSAADLKAYLLLAAHAGAGSRVSVSHRRLAELGSIDRRTLRRAFATLESAGLITRLSEGTKRSCFELPEQLR